MPQSGLAENSEDEDDQFHCPMSIISISRSEMLCIYKLNNLINIYILHIYIYILYNILYYIIQNILQLLLSSLSLLCEILSIVTITRSWQPTSGKHYPHSVSLSARWEAPSALQSCHQPWGMGIAHSYLCPPLPIAFRSKYHLQTWDNLGLFSHEYIQQWP